MSKEDKIFYAMAAGLDWESDDSEDEVLQQPLKEPSLPDLFKDEEHYNLISDSVSSIVCCCRLCSTVMLSYSVCWGCLIVPVPAQSFCFFFPCWFAMVCLSAGLLGSCSAFLSLVLIWWLLCWCLCSGVVCVSVTLELFCYGSDCYDAVCVWSRQFFSCGFADLLCSDSVLLSARFYGLILEAFCSAGAV